MKMNELIAKIEQWAEDRNIIKGSKPIDQAMKLFSEAGELADNVGKGRDCRDDIGDIFIVLTIIGAQTDIGMWESIENDYIDSEDPDYEYNKVTNNLNFGMLEGIPIKNLVIELQDKLAGFFSESYDLNGEYDDHILSSVEILNAIAVSSDYTLEECVQIAYNDIKDRVGILWNGVFVKNTDENYDEVKLMFEKSLESNFN